jgi:glyoxylase-like metal-dependent hydrolase (beta-lactamase superfamily II)
MFFIQHPSSFSSLSYLFGCAGKSAAVAVDVLPEDVDNFVQMATEKGVNILYVIDTHLHADHYSGGRKLAEKTGAAYCLHQSAQTEFTYKSLSHGEHLTAGNVGVEVIHTPGHTDDDICLLITDNSRCHEPWFVLTGHTLFPGGVGRPDLHGREREMAGKLYDSIYGRLLSLPDHLEIYAGAMAGSVCGGGISAKPSSTIGFEKRHNPSLIRNKEQFVDNVTSIALDVPVGIKDFYHFNIGKSA